MMMMSVQSISLQSPKWTKIILIYNKLGFGKQVCTCPKKTFKNSWTLRMASYIQYTFPTKKFQCFIAKYCLQF